MQSTRYSCQILMELELFPQIFEKYSRIKFHEELSCGSGVVPCGRTDRQTDRQTDMSKRRVAFRNFANAPKNQLVMYRTQVAVCFQIHLKHTNTLCGNGSMLNLAFFSLFCPKYFVEATGMPVTHTRARAHTHTHIHTHPPTHTHTHTHPHTHTQNT
jgi:hypothetical protein